MLLFKLARGVHFERRELSAECLISTIIMLMYVPLLRFHRTHIHCGLVRSCTSFINCTTVCVSTPGFPFLGVPL